MKWLKKIFIAGLLFFVVTSANFAQAQNSGHKNINSNNYNTWINTGEAGCGKGSFYMYVYQYYNSSEKVYYYEIYIWSDSYYRNCDASYTYIDDVEILTYNNGRYTNILTMDYYLASPKSGNFSGWNYMAYVYSSSSKQQFKIKWGSVSTY